jgi:hypothetical protein
VRRCHAAGRNLLGAGAGVVRGMDIERLLSRLDDVAGTPHGVDHGRVHGVYLFTQVGDVQLHNVGLAAEVIVPDPIEDLGLADDRFSIR